MEWTDRGHVALGLGAMTMLLGSVVAIQAASSSASSSPVNSVDRSKQAVRLFRDLKVDAVTVRSAAARLDGLTQSAGANWLDYDRQWNEIKPSVEDMQIKLARLETMQAALSSNELTELNQTKPVIAEIQSRTRQFLTLLNTPGVQVSDAKFRACARSLRNEADKIEKLVPVA
jgi:hypothetical protein